MNSEFISENTSSMLHDYPHHHDPNALFAEFLHPVSPVPPRDFTDHLKEFEHKTIFYFSICILSSHEAYNIRKSELVLCSNVFYVAMKIAVFCEIVINSGFRLCFIFMQRFPLVLATV